MPVTDSRRLRRWPVTAIMMAALLGMISSPARAVEGETFAITEVDFGARTIQVTNHGTAAVDPNGVIVCSFPVYAPIAGAAMLAPGESVTVDLAAIGVPIGADDGELGLYLNSEFEDPTAIVSYVEWGSPDHPRSSVAQAAEVGGAAVWTGGFVDTAGESVLTATVAFPTSPASWQTGAGATLPRTGAPGRGGVLVGLALLTAGVGLLALTRRRASR